jgi:hypothetical protein
MTGMSTAGAVRKWSVAAMVVLAGVVCAAAPADAHVYWTNAGDGTISRSNNDGSGTVQNLVTGLRTPVGVAVNGSHLFISQQAQTTIARANLDGSGLDQNFISGTRDPYQLATDQSQLYWAAFQFGYSVSRANLDGSGFNPTFVQGGSPVGLAIDLRYVYYGNVGTNTIGRAAKFDGGGVNHSFITGASNPNGVAVDNRYVYWTNTATGTIGRARLDGTEVEQDFIIGASAPIVVAVDGRYVYWTNYSGQSIGRARLDGGAVDQNFITGARSPVGLAVDARWSGPDGDGDGTPDGADKCPTTPDADQRNADRDSLGDACDTDRHGGAEFPTTIGTAGIGPREFMDDRAGSWVVDSSRPAKVAGVITSIDYWASASGKIRFFVSDPAGTVKWVSPVVTTASWGQRAYVLYSPITVDAGDRLGVYWSGNPVISYEEEIGTVVYGAGGSGPPVRRGSITSDGTAERTYAFGARVRSPLFTTSSTARIGAPGFGIRNRAKLDTATDLDVISTGLPATQAGTISSVQFYAAARGNLRFFLADSRNNIKYITAGLRADTLGWQQTYEFWLTGGPWSVAPGDRLGYWAEGAGVIPYDEGISEIAYAFGYPGRGLNLAGSASRIYSYGASVEGAPLFSSAGRPATKVCRSTGRVTRLVAKNVGCATAGRVARARANGRRARGFSCRSKRAPRGRTFTCRKRGSAGEVRFVLLRG